jgi:hypothetical protein
MALDPRDPVDELFFVKGFEAPAGDESQHFLLLSTVIPASRALERPLHLIETNFLDVVEPLVERSPYIGVHINIGAAMLLGSRVGTLRFPSAYDEALPDDVGWRFTDYVEAWSTQALEIETHGALERVEKIPRVVAHEPARRHLRVCWATDGRAFNCGRCNKCVRTVLNQELAGCPGVIETLPPHLSARRIAKTPVGRPENALGLQECLREAKRQGRTDVVDALRRCFARGELPPTGWRRVTSRLDRTQRRLRYSLGKRRTRRALRRHRRRHGHDHLFLTCEGACGAR